MQPRFLRVTVLIVAMLALGACSSGPGSRIDYKEAKTLPSLEVPPDLSYPAEQDIARLPRTGAPGAEDTFGVLPVGEGVRIERDRSARWLVVDRSAAELWPQLRSFWTNIGLELQRDEPHLGIMETEWGENRADAPGGFLTGLIRSVFKNAYSANTRDKYRLRVEPREGGRTEIHISHYGLQEVVAVQSAEIIQTAWNLRPSDPELVHELLNRLVVHLGGTPEQAVRLQEAADSTAPPARTRVEGDTLIVSEGYSRTWRRTGNALDQAGLIIMDRNLSEGIYYVNRYDALRDGRGERGRIRSLFSRADGAQETQSLQIVLAGNEQATRIWVRDEKGGLVSQEEATAILEKLAELLQ